MVQRVIVSKEHRMKARLVMWERVGIQRIRTRVCSQVDQVLGEGVTRGERTQEMQTEGTGVKEGGAWKYVGDSG